MELGQISGNIGESIINFFWLKSEGELFVFGAMCYLLYCRLRDRVGITHGYKSNIMVLSPLLKIRNFVAFQDSKVSNVFLT